MAELTSVTGIVALAAGAVAVVSLLLAAVLGFRVRRLRRSQSAVLGESGEDDLVAHAERIERGFVDLRDWVEEIFGGLDERLAHGERRIDGCLAYRALVRYDAYGEMSGLQSSSIALLDTQRSGMVISSILHRDQARVYVKQVREGESEIELSPEEREALEAALAPAEAPRA